MGDIRFIEHETPKRICKVAHKQISYTQVLVRDLLFIHIFRSCLSMDGQSVVIPQPQRGEPMSAQGKAQRRPGFVMTTENLAPRGRP